MLLLVLHNDPEKWPRLLTPLPASLSLFRMQAPQGQQSYSKQLSCANITCRHQAKNNTYMRRNSWNCASHSRMATRVAGRDWDGQRLPRIVNIYSIRVPEITKPGTQSLTHCHEFLAGLWCVFMYQFFESCSSWGCYLDHLHLLLNLEDLSTLESRLLSPTCLQGTRNVLSSSQMLWVQNSQNF